MIGSGATDASLARGRSAFHNIDGTFRSLEEHPLPALAAAGVRCSVSTDDPVMFDTDLTREYEAAEALGLDPRTLYETALAGALCDDATRARLSAIGAAWKLSWGQG